MVAEIRPSVMTEVQLFAAICKCVDLEEDEERGTVPVERHPVRGSSNHSSCVKIVE